MIPYFYHLNKKLFSDELIIQVNTLVKSRLNDFIEYRFGEDNSETDGNNYYLAKDLRELEEIKSLISNCKLSCFPMIVLHKPNSKVIKHIDDPYKRNTVIITPVNPETNYPPTYFWDNDNVIATCEFTKGSAVFFNTQFTHSLNNDSDEYRYNLQICFDEDFETVLKLYQDGMLFKE